MQTQACMPCAMRKVRCDRKEPCSNCRRRKQDKCTYPPMAPTERIKQLESLVRSLTRDSEPGMEQSSQRSRALSKNSPGDASASRSHRSNDPTLMEEDGEPIYLESCTWHTWAKTGSRSGTGRQPSHVKAYPRVPVLPAATAPCALQSILQCDPTVDIANRHPSLRHISIIWDAFYRNVNPMLKIAFDWELDSLRATTTSSEGHQDFSPSEHTFLFALYLVSIVSLSNDECLESFSQPKSSLISEYTLLCEQAMCRSNFLIASEIILIQAFIMYIAAGLSFASSRSLWSLIGLTIRSAERLGLHRDGTALGLTPAETEKRRRIWWQLQSVDLALGIRCGSMPITLTAEWDTKLPLNIEDDDIGPGTKEMPKERKGMTSMSFCLWRFWVLREQRSFRRADGSRIGTSWVADESLSWESKEALINQLESGLNSEFIRYCDPIRPLDFLIQLGARSFLCGMRRFMVHSQVYNNDAPDDSEMDENKLLDLCIRCLEYDVSLNSYEAIKKFRWYTDGAFPWSAFVYVISETWRQHDTSRAEHLWNLICNLYAANRGLSEITEDRRRYCAAELLILAWGARENFLLEQDPQNSNLHPQARTPALIKELEFRRATANTNETSFRGSTGRTLYEARESEVVAPKGIEPTDHGHMDTFVDYTLNSIPWSFWGSSE